MKTLLGFKYHVHIFESNSIKSALSLLKTLFLRANLTRAPGDHLPHASYRNKGNYARYMKSRGYFKKSRKWTLKK